MLLAAKRTAAAAWRRWRKAAGVTLAGTLAAGVVADQSVFRGHGDRPGHVANAAQLFTATAPRTEQPAVALLVNGGFTLGKNHRRYWNNLSLMYRTLGTLGFRSVRVLDADGQAGVPDRNVRSILGVLSNGSYEDSPTDLDGDGKPDVAGPATKAALGAELARLGADTRAGEHVFVFLTDHGQLRQRDGATRSVFMMWNEELSGEELDRMLTSSLPKDAWTTVLATQCHSARFLEEVKRPRTTFMASGAPLWIWSDQDYSVFPYHFAAAFLRRDPETLVAVDADANRDGRVSMSEAFVAASRLDHTPEWPRAWALDAEGQRVAAAPPAGDPSF